MKRIIILVAIASLVSSLTATEALAEQERQLPRTSSYYLTQLIRQYDPKTVETLSGEVLSITKTTSRRGREYGVHLLVKTDAETIEVHLGPEWYLDSQKFSIEVGDSLELKGSRVIYNGKPTIIAARLTKKDRVLTLRDDNGLPLWSRRQR